MMYSGCGFSDSLIRGKISPSYDLASINKKIGLKYSKYFSFFLFILNFGSHSSELDDLILAKVFPSKF